MSVLKEFLVEYVASKTRTFGGGKGSCWGNPIAEALKDQPAQFAAGVSVAEVVEHVLEGMKLVKAQAESATAEIESLGVSPSIR